MLALAPPIPLRVWTIDWKVLKGGQPTGKVHETWRLTADESGTVVVFEKMAAGPKYPDSTSEMHRIMGPGGTLLHEDWTYRTKAFVRRYVVDYRAEQARMRESQPGWRMACVANVPKGVPRHDLTPRYVAGLAKASKPSWDAMFSMDRAHWSVARISIPRRVGNTTVFRIDYPHSHAVLTYDADFRMRESTGTDGYHWIRTGVHEGP